MKKRKCVTLPCVSHQQRDSHLKHPCPRSSWWHMIILLCTNLSPLSHSLCSPRVRKHKTVWAALKTIRPRAQWWWRQASVQPRGQPPWVKPRQGLSSSGALVSTCTTLNQHIPEKWLTLWGFTKPNFTPWQTQTSVNWWQIILILKVMGSHAPWLLHEGFLSMTLSFCINQTLMWRSN